MTRDEIIRALRCSAAYNEAADCTGCPYLLEETLDGEPWLSCDVDKILLDAAALLEQDGALQPLPPEPEEVRVT